MDLCNNIFEILSSDPNNYILLCSREETNIISDGCAALCKENLYSNGLKGLPEIVNSKDKFLCEGFLEKLGDIVKSGTDDTLECNLRLRTTDDNYEYFKIKCIFHSNSSGGSGTLLVVISLLPPEEVYRIELAKVFTNDRSPIQFIGQAKKVMEKSPDKDFALIQFDISKFKVINEQYGESAGDEILEYFTGMLNMICSENQIFTRLSADVFMVLTPYEKEKDVEDMIYKINSSLTGYKNIPYTLYFGASYITDKTKPIRKYGDEAAMARQSIKGDALNHVAFYTDEMKTRKKQQKYLEDHMEEALNNHEFVMFLQPKYSISLNKIVGAEALVRWISQEKGIISPGEFIPLFEENGFVIKMDRFIWEEACKLIKHWLDMGIQPLPISVNMSRKHFESDNSVEFLNELIEKYGIEKKYLEIEITETIDDINKEKGIDLLKKSGYTLLMDDFGSGYSSLNTLKNTQFDVVKIDRFFLQDLIDSERGQKIVEHTIHMAKDIGLALIAEGVETEEQANFLKQCGCDVAQGFFYARPMDVEAFQKLRNKNS